MEKSKLYIPDKITVGYLKREDTYSKRLSFVTYIDTKGVFRQERSWEGWRDKDIAPEVFDNVPTTGFVLNKTAGGYRTGWNTRQLKCRVYDPRGIEIEITFENVLFILNCGDSYRGKGLSGEFVYAWSGKDIILLPVASEDYISSKQFTNLQSQKVGKKDIVVGGTYITKDNKEVVYIGKYPYYIPNYSQQYITKEYYKIYGDKKHIFMSTDGEQSLDAYDGYVNIKAVVSTEENDSFASLRDSFIYGAYSSPAVSLELDDVIETDVYDFKRYVYSYGSKDGWINTFEKTGRTVDENMTKVSEYSEIDKFTGQTNSSWYYNRHNNTTESVKGKYKTLYKVFQNGYKLNINI